MEYCTLQIPGVTSGQPSLLRCRWQLNGILDAISQIYLADLYVSYDVRFGLHHIDLVSQSEVASFLANAAGQGKAETLIKLVLPAVTGYVIRSDQLEFRMHKCTAVRQVVSFLKPLQRVEAFQADGDNDNVARLRIALNTAVGAILPEPGEGSSERLEDEMRNRLSLEWFSKESIAPKRVAYIKAPYDPLSFGALKSMGIELIVLDEHGSWLEDDQGPNAHLRKHFIPFDTNPDAGFKKRLKEVASRFRVDGIFSRPEVYFPMIAEVCQELGLPTSPPEAVRNGIDKYFQRQLHNDDGESFRVSNLDDLQKRLESGIHPLQFPLVVKPRTGAGSQCVNKVMNKEELFQAVAKIQTRFLGYEGDEPIGTDSLIEPYISGPEIDANLVLWDGKLLFYEISDDFPSTADKDESTMQDDFQETLFVYPSKLPEQEQQAIRDSLHQSVLRLGFSSGVFHVEARVRNSVMYHEDREDGLGDLAPLPAAPVNALSVFLLEVNIRPPAYLGLMTASWTYGIDYFALWALSVVGDAARFKALTRPFLRGPQYASALIIVAPERGGTLISDDPAVELKRKRPDLMEKIQLYREVWTKGDVVPAPDGPTMWYISAISVFSSKSRSDLLQTVRDIRNEWKHEII